MALSWEEFSGASGQTTVPVNVAYLDKSDIHLEINDVEVTGFTWASDTVITLPSTISIVAGDKITIIRKTDRTVLRLLFSEGAAFTRDNIDEQNDQFLYLAQELVEGRSIDGFYGELSMNGYRIIQLGTPVDAADAANKDYVDNTVEEEAHARQSADANLQSQISNSTPLEASAFSPVSWHAQELLNSIDIPDNKNAWTFGPKFYITKGQAVRVGANSAWTIADGREYAGTAEDLVVNTLTSADGSRVLSVLDIADTESVEALGSSLDTTNKSLEALDTRLTTEEQKVQSIILGGTGATSITAARDNLGLGAAAQLGVGTTSNTVAAGDDPRFSGRLKAVRVITSTQQYTPSSDTSFYIVRLVSGGGAGASAAATTASTVSTGSGGASGGLLEVLLTSADVGTAAITVTIGAGGVVSAGTNGGDGGASSFGSIMSVAGGLGGRSGNGLSASTAYTPIAAAAQQAAPVTTKGTVLVALAPSTGTLGEAHTTIVVSGSGGSTLTGTGGRRSGGAGNNGTGNGSGGSGASVTASGAAALGGAGTAGICYIYEFSGV